MSTLNVLDIHRNYKRQEYKDILFTQLYEFAVIQKKHDGIWAKVVIDSENFGYVYSRTGTLKKTFLNNVPLLRNSILLGEYIFGSQRSMTDPLKGHIVLFDVLVFNGVDVTQNGYAYNYYNLDFALSGVDSILKCANIISKEELVRNNENNIEGYVARSRHQKYDAPVHRFKFEVEEDYVILGVEEGKGRLMGTMGAITVGYIDKDKEVEVMKVGGGFTDDFRDLIWRNFGDFYLKVAKIIGKGKFESGALRHPNFLYINSEKTQASVTHESINS